MKYLKMFIILLIGFFFRVAIEEAVDLDYTYQNNQALKKGLYWCPQEKDKNADCIEKYIYKNAKIQYLRHLLWRPNIYYCYYVFKTNECIFPSLIPKSHTDLPGDEE